MNSLWQHYYLLENITKKKIAEKIFKPKQTPELKDILNGLMDLFHYRMAMLIAQKSEEIEEPIFVKICYSG